jgi:hypothetical protein
MKVAQFENEIDLKQFYLFIQTSQRNKVPRNKFFHTALESFRGLCEKQKRKSAVF